MPNNKMERFTQRARRVLSIAQEEAERKHYKYIGTEHMLMGLLLEEGGIAGRVLRDLGLEHQRVEELIEELNAATAKLGKNDAELSSGSKRILELSVDEARRMGHHYIGTEHLLLGLVRQSEGVAIDVLKRLGVSPEEVRRQTRRVLQEAPVQPNLGTVLNTSPAAIPAPPEARRRLPADAYEMLENVLMKILEMIGADKLPIAQGVELFATLTPNLKLPSTLQNQLTGKFFDALLQQYVDKQKLGDYKVRLTAIDAKGAEIFNHSDVPLTTLLTEIDRFLAGVLNDPTTPMVFTLCDSNLEVRIEKDTDQA